MALLIHDPRDDEAPRKRAPITDSYWQRGCDDAKAGRPPKPPTSDGPHSRRNVGYANGYAYGKTHYRIAEVGKRIVARSLGSAVPSGVGERNA